MTESSNPLLGSRRSGLLIRLLAAVILLTSLDGLKALFGAHARVMSSPIARDTSLLEARQTTETCFRWAQQSAVINGTLYLYGGHASTVPDQQFDTWNNDLISVSLTDDWAIASPSQQALPKPSGPPPVSNAYLWSSQTSFYLYGGAYSDKPEVSPLPFKFWEYNAVSSKWTSHERPQTSSGKNAPEGSTQVESVAEGAGANAPGLGRGWYFGGHLDYKTTAGWSIDTARVYIKSLLEFTFPGSENKAVEDLSDGQAAGAEGVWRNITQGGSQAEGGFPERADGVLLYVPGIGDQGILVGLAGGTADRFSQLNVIDVFDVSTSMWYKQGTAGTTPKIRVNPCAVVAAAADGTSYNVYMHGGQNLQPADAQTQLDDMWILSLPSFTWIKVDTGGQSVPPARAGHTCNIWDGQMVVVGGYMPSTEITCDSPGIYVFNTSSLEWVQTFSPISDKVANPQSKQLSQLDDDLSLPGSYGYSVPDAVQKAIGGGPAGGATLTVPVASATAGPLATGKPRTYDIQGGPNGSGYKGFGNSNENNNGGSGNNNKTKTIAIAVGVVAGVLALVVVYLAVCAFLYRKQLRQYQEFMEAERAEKARNAMSNTASNTSSGGPTSRSGGRRGDYHAVDSGYNSGSGRESGEKANPVLKDSTDDLLAGQEPTFVGIMLHPRRSLRVVNR